MNCERPILAIKRDYLNENGKASIKIMPTSTRVDLSIEKLESLYGKENVLKLPCGKCTACKEAYRADWSVRCDMEARYHKDNCFLTLTYRDEVCPHYVSKGHIRRFVRKLRRFGIDCMYFSCGEYGELNGRPHYHMILFGYFPADAELVEGAKTKSGFEVYHSVFLDKVWNKGFVDVNNFSQDTAFYVAGYVNKKTGKYDGFLNMSNGIGYQYMIDHFRELFIRRTYVARSGRVHFLPRAFKRVCEKLGYYHEEDPLTVINLRKMENSEMVARGYTHREQLFGLTSMKMKDKLERRRKRL